VKEFIFGNGGHNLNLVDRNDGANGINGEKGIERV
jgi:hypothetical protein